MINEVVSYINEMYPEALCELYYKNDYEFLIAVVLSAQTTDKRVNMVTPVLFNKYKTLKDLSNAKIEDVQEIIKPIGTYHKKAIYVVEIAKKLVDEYDSIVPKTHKELEKLPGVGRKTANVVLGNIYNADTFAVDTHVARVTKRLGFVKENDDVLQIEKKMKRKLRKDIWTRTHHQLVLFGRYHCKAKNPDCNSCKISALCKYYKKNK